jgi:quinol monooxygenase YgiN
MSSRALVDGGTRDAIARCGARCSIPSLVETAPVARSIGRCARRCLAEIRVVETSTLNAAVRAGGAHVSKPHSELGQISPQKGFIMAAPFFVIRTFTIKPGKLDRFKQSLPDLFKAIEAKEPGTLALNAYLNEQGTEVNFVHVYADAASMEVHETVAHADTSKVSEEFLEVTTSLQIYGKPNDMILKKTRELAEKGIPFKVTPEHVGGFTRLTTAAH